MQLEDEGARLEALDVVVEEVFLTQDRRHLISLQQRLALKLLQCVLFALEDDQVNFTVGSLADLPQTLEVVHGNLALSHLAAIDHGLASERRSVCLGCTQFVRHSDTLRVVVTTDDTAALGAIHFVTLSTSQPFSFVLTQRRGFN